MSEFTPGEIVKQSPSTPVEQKPLIPLGGENPQQAEAGTETENAYEDMTSFFLLRLIREGNLPIEAVPIYFQNLRQEELDRATGAMYKRKPINSVERKFEKLIAASNAKILAEDYNDPQKIAREVAMIEAKYSRLMTNPQEQACYFANEANDLAQYPHWKTPEDTTRANTWAANLYGMASQLARGRAGAPQQAGTDAQITTVRTALQTEAKPAA